MRSNLFLLFSFVTLINLTGWSQPINSTSSYMMLDGEGYMRFHYENDFFTAVDCYYSQGISIEDVSHGLNKFPLAKLLLHDKAVNSTYGIAVEHDAFTPTSIRHNEILYGDRPFAATLFLKTFCIYNTGNNERITSTLFTGVLGKDASGMWMQKSIHRWLKNIEPLGWQNQIKSDILLNYQIQYEKNIIRIDNHFLLNGFAEINAGICNDKFSIGVVIMTGRFNSKINSAFCDNKLSSEKRKLNFHLYAQPLFSLIGYDATLQGGLFNSESPYVIKPDNISRVTFKATSGLVLTYESLYLEYFQSLITKEFKTGLMHHWGGIRIGVII